MKVNAKVVVRNPVGLHLRAAAELIDLEKKYRCKIWIKKGIELVNARSILCLLQLAAVFGTELNFIFDGDDAMDAMDAIQTFFTNTLNLF